MSEDNCEILFEYLRSILYDTVIKTPDIGQLDLEYRKLGQGLQVLEQLIEELKMYSENLSRGNLSVETPRRDNFLCGNLKNLHANLNHLTWQAKQVAAGDYSQHVSYLGEFSEAFNTMTEQLKERENRLKQETVKSLKRAEIIEEYNELLMQLTQKRKEIIFVVNSETKEIVYCNKQQRIVEDSCEDYVCDISFLNQLLNWKEGEQYKTWEKTAENGTVYRINTFPVEWKNQNAFVHILEDITIENKDTQKLMEKAYRDPITGIANRLFFEEQMKKLMAKEEDFVLCYLDLDELKHVNDTYGHTEGDHYIHTFVETIKKNIRMNDLFARTGGDEFCMVLKGCTKTKLETKMKSVREHFIADNKKPYFVSFSYGIVEIHCPKDTDKLEKILKEADMEMYKCKKRHKTEKNKLDIF
jgi:diguanylate cyclase (GGDEF)-like protein